MFADYEDFSVTSPFWFADSELLAIVLRTEIKAIMQLFAKYPVLDKLFDVAEVTIPQRTACFELLAHRKVIEIIDETVEGRYQRSPVLSNEESIALARSQRLVAPDAPAWVLEIDRVAESLLFSIYHTLPEPLRNEVAYRTDPAKSEAVHLATKTLSTVEQIQALIARVFDEQLQRLSERWATMPIIPSQTHQIQPEQFRITGSPRKRKARRSRDRQRLLRDKLIAEIDDVSETTTEFLQLMDERKVKPQPTWSGWPGSWKDAYKNPRLRVLIHKDKSRALSRARHSK